MFGMIMISVGIVKDDADR